MIRSAAQHFNNGGGEPQEDEWAPACEVGVVRSHFGAGACDAPASRSCFFDFPLLIVLVQRFQKCHKRRNVVCWLKGKGLKGNASQRVSPVSKRPARARLDMPI